MKHTHPFRTVRRPRAALLALILGVSLLPSVPAAADSGPYAANYAFSTVKQNSWRDTTQTANQLGLVVQPVYPNTRGDKAYWQDLEMVASQNADGSPDAALLALSQTSEVQDARFLYDVRAVATGYNTLEGYLPGGTSHRWSDPVLENPAYNQPKLVGPHGWSTGRQERSFATGVSIPNLGLKYELIYQNVSGFGDTNKSTIMGWFTQNDPFLSYRSTAYSEEFLVNLGLDYFLTANTSQVSGTIPLLNKSYKDIGGSRAHDDNGNPIRSRVRVIRRDLNANTGITLFCYWQNNIPGGPERDAGARVTLLDCFLSRRLFAPDLALYTPDGDRLTERQAVDLYNSLAPAVSITPGKGGSVDYGVEGRLYVGSSLDFAFPQNDLYQPQTIAITNTNGVGKQATIPNADGTYTLEALPPNLSALMENDTSRIHVVMQRAQTFVLDEALAQALAQSSQPAAYTTREARGYDKTANQMTFEESTATLGTPDEQGKCTVTNLRSSVNFGLGENQLIEFEGQVYSGSADIPFSPEQILNQREFRFRLFSADGTLTVGPQTGDAVTGEPSVSTFAVTFPAASADRSVVFFDEAGAQIDTPDGITPRWEGDTLQLSQDGSAAGGTHRFRVRADSLYSNLAAFTIGQGQPPQGLREVTLTAYASEDIGLYTYTLVDLPIPAGGVCGAPQELISEEAGTFYLYRLENGAYTLSGGARWYLPAVQKKLGITSLPSEKIALLKIPVTGCRDYNDYDLTVYIQVLEGSEATHPAAVNLMQAHSQNAENITHSTRRGTASYDAATQTLTLDNAVIFPPRNYDLNAYGAIRSTGNLTLRLVGNNSIDQSATAITAQGEASTRAYGVALQNQNDSTITLTGPGKLTIFTANNSYALGSASSLGNLCYQSGTLILDNSNILLSLKGFSVADDAAPYWWRTSPTGDYTEGNFAIPTDDQFTYFEITDVDPYPADAPRYTITFLLRNGASIDGQTGSYTMTTGKNGRLASVPTPQRPGFIFDCWYRGNAMMNKVTTDTVFTADTIVKGNWWFDTTPGAPLGIETQALPYELNPGTVTTTPTTAQAGEEVTVQVTPNEGWVLDTLTVRYKYQDNYQNYPIQNNRFTMPNSTVVVTGTFKEDTTPRYAEEPAIVTGLVFNGQTQTGVLPGVGYTLTGNTATDAGTHTATATLVGRYVWAGGSTGARTFDWEIAPLPQEPPAGLGIVAPTAADSSDGQITGTTYDMEWAADPNGPYTACEGTTVPDLAPGRYYVRFQASTNYAASPAVQLEIPAFDQTVTGIALSPVDTTVALSAIETYDVAPEVTATGTTTGNADPGTLTVSLGGTSPEAFVLSTETLTALTDSGSTQSFTVYPAADLPIGTYEATVTVADEDGALLAQSFALTFTVTEKTNLLERIAVTAEPYQTAYHPGDSFDPTGMEVTATYNDDTQRVLPLHKLTMTPDPLSLDDTEVTIVYAEKGTTQSTTQAITVTEAPVLTGISITQPPAKTDYRAGQVFDPKGMEVTATYSDQTSAPVTGYAYTPAGALTEQDTRIEISYTENGQTFTDTVAITVTQPSEPGDGGGGSIPTYAITLTPAEHGTITASRKQSPAGSVITLTIQPHKGYQLDGLTVLDSAGRSVPLTEAAANRFTFPMPNRPVTVSGSFVPQPPAQPEPGETETPPEALPFADVPAGSYYYEALRWALEQNIAAGIAPQAFGPDQPCTRAQAVTFLWRAAGSPAPQTRELPFTDVPAGSYYRSAVLWATEQGILSGTSATTFSPEAPCTRGQIVSLLWRWKNSPATEKAAGFADVEPQAYYAAAIHWAAAQGIAAGTGDSRFTPHAPCTRAEIVTFLYRCVMPAAAPTV